MYELVDFDMALLLAINGWNALWADNVMWIISGKLTWIPLYLLLIGLLWWRFGWKRALLLTLALVAVVGLSDWTSGLIKHAVCRWRPAREPLLDGLVHVVNGYRGGRFGFVSSHAANTMGLSLLFCMLYNKYSHHVWWLMLWVGMNCWSRMYLGVHYPGDIVGGLLLGSFWAVIAYVAIRLTRRRIGADIGHK